MKIKYDGVLIVKATIPHYSFYFVNIYITPMNTPYEIDYRSMVDSLISRFAFLNDSNYVIRGGDWNAKIGCNDAVPYEGVTWKRGGNPLRCKRGIVISHLLDGSGLFFLTGLLGSESDTWCNSNLSSRIDHFMINSNVFDKVKNSGVMCHDNFLKSDHLPIYMECEFKNELSSKKNSFVSKRKTRIH